MRHFWLAALLLVLVGCGKEEVNYGNYSIGRDSTWFPLQLDEQAPNINGFTNALVQEIAKVEHKPLSIVNIDSGQLFTSLKGEEVGGIFTALAPDTITQGKYDFSDPFLFLGPVLVVPYDSKAASLADLHGKIVAINQFDESVLIVQRYPSIIIRLYQSAPLVLESLKNGEFDGVLMPILDAQTLIPQLYAQQLKIVTTPLNNKALRLITLKGSNKSLLRHFNRGLEKTLSSGKYSQLRTTYQLAF